MRSVTKLKAQEIAEYFLGSVDLESGDSISNLKLQKLLYYAQGLHVAMHLGKPLFPEPLVAWEHGPVVESVYFHYKSYGWRSIDRPESVDLQAYPPEIRELLDAVSEHYGQFSAKRLESMTHQELPWRNTAANLEISIALLQEFFSTIVEAGRRDEAVEGEPVWPSNAFHHQNRRAISDRLKPHREHLGRIARQAASESDPWSDED